MMALLATNSLLLLYQVMREKVVCFLKIFSNHLFYFNSVLKKKIRQK